MARHAKVLQLLRDDKGICNASFRIIAQFYNAIRLRYMRIVFVFDFAQNFCCGSSITASTSFDFLLPFDNSQAVRLSLDKTIPDAYIQWFQLKAPTHAHRTERRLPSEPHCEGGIRYINLRPPFQNRLASDSDWICHINQVGFYKGIHIGFNGVRGYII